MTESPNLTPQPQTVVVRYTVAAGRLEPFTALLAQHVPTLRDLGLATPAPAECFAAEEQDGQPTTVFEIFSWAGPSAAGTAHTHPAVTKIWEQMAQLSVGDGRPVSTPVVRLDVS
ncbi:MAG TPA: hypothetical protein VGP31_01665 [Planosporangium sp.]|jgi:hypothetical protein|nr:hypothetical protein [Planosporangium sp.]